MLPVKVSHDVIETRQDRQGPGLGAEAEAEVASGWAEAEAGVLFRS